MYLVAGLAAADPSPTSTTSSSSPAKPTLPAALLTRIRKAMELTTSESAHNITAAREAVALWDDVHSEAPLPPAILSASLGLHASALTRTGDDKRAEKVYARALLPEMQPYLNPNSFRDICFGRAYALQRLMRYEEAVEQFQTYLNEDNQSGRRDDVGQAIYAAATCALRTEDWDKAIGILKEYVEGTKGGDALDGRNVALFAFMRHVEDSAATAAPFTEKLLTQALELDQRSPLINWLHLVITGGKDIAASNFDQMVQVDFLDLAALNQCPLDDSRLIHLDDKILLHQLLSRGDSNKFWPLGFVLPGEKDRFANHVKQVDTSSPWILKDRAGYGSHGNRVVSLDEVLAENAKEEAQALCQQIVHPPLLIDGRKFSMRVYVICCVNGVGENNEFYISSEGLAKLASDPYDFNSDKAFMTNSGLGEGDDTVQLDFHELRRRFEKEGWDYENLWQGIVDSARSTMLAYQSYCKKEETSDKKRNLCRLLSTRARVPKLLGLDFLVDENQKPWLIEVNRFPGLEPRGSSDEAVKRQVVTEAWDLARLKAFGTGAKVGEGRSISLKLLL